MTRSILINAVVAVDDPLVALVERGASIQRATCGVSVLRMRGGVCEQPVVFRPQASYLLVVPALTDEDLGKSRLANLVDGGTVRQSADDWLLAYLPVRAFESIAGRWQLSANPVTPGVHPIEDDATARHLCLTLLCAPRPERPLDVLFNNSIAKALLAHFLDTYCAATTPSAILPGLRLSPWQLRIAEETMLDRIDQRLPISTVAERCGVSVVHFSRAFRRSTSETPHRWLMRRRLERACVLLAETNDSITDIALACGFSDQSHLTRTFSILLNTTPAVWRQMQRRQRLREPDE
ncbi:AraC family transcriptional regulator [Luteibacter sp. UNCMF331Sha3.1]|uniref:helix-turn-helix domain-containing protein n=1 Tax=Luteibacter sp. UNCMF331Sha3.1 TaxID=1502760 RepID=UPI00147D7D4B|nr:AraC family transcriptional regulator [Luteibacter sp. UNCMF331Sha3.1]